MAKSKKKEAKRRSEKQIKTSKKMRSKKLSLDKDTDTMGVTDGEMKSHFRAAFMRRPT